MLARRRYDWNGLFKRKRFTLLPEDYSCQPHSMAQQVRNAARLRDKRVSVRIAPGGVISVFVLEKP